MSLGGSGEHAGSQQQDVSIAQRGQRFAQGEVDAGIEAGQQRELNHRDPGFRVHQGQRHEHAVIPAAVRIEHDGNIALAQQRFDGAREFRLTRSRVFDLIGLRREASVIVNELRVAARRDARLARLPMGADHHDGIRRVEICGQLAEVRDQLIVAGIAKQRQRTAAVRHINYRCFYHVGLTPRSFAACRGSIRPR